jgi:TIR domain-containing protein
MTTADKIFISHASADRKLADLLRDTLVLGGIPRERIFYSSSRATGIPSGTDVRAHLRGELQQAGLVIELISATFLTRPMCLIELGGAWVLEKSTYPIVVPPLTRTQAVAQIGDVHMGQLSSDEEIDDVFDELHDRLTSDVGLSTTATGWNPVARRFKEGLPAVLAALAAAAAPPAPTPSAPPPAASSRPPAKISVDNYAVVQNGYGTEVQGEATNNDTVEHTALLKATFYDESSKIVGTADGVVNQLAPGETKTFTLMSTNAIRQYARLKVQVDAIY